MAKPGARWFAAWVGVSIFMAGLTGCSFLRPHASQPKARVKSLQSKNGEPGSGTVRALQIEVMRFADNYAAIVARVSDDFILKTTGGEARRVATKWKLEQATAAYINASGPNPIISALDMVVLATASRMVMEDALSRRPFGEAADALLDTHRKLETNAWILAGTVLKPEQLDELQEIIAEWRRNNPQQRNVAGLRFREFMGAMGKKERPNPSPTSVFSLLFLDPMASIDPTTSAIEETRNTAERAMYYAQRTPMLLHWQIELLTYELAVQPETKQLLADSARFARASESFAKSAEDLPKVIGREREAAINQVLEGLAPEERKAKELLSEARALANETRDTLKVGNLTAETIQSAIKTLDEFVRSVTPTNVSTTATKRRPYDVLDYATTARDVGSAARDVTVLLDSADKNAGKLSDLRQQTIADAKSIVDHAYARALKFSLLLVGTVFVAALIYRFVASRTARASH